MNSLPEDQIETIYSKSVAEMITVANDYCLFVEKAESYSIDLILSYLQKVCPLLYIKGSLLPDVEVTDDSANECFVTGENWESYFSMFNEKFGDKDLFWSIDIDAITGIKPLQFSLAEQIADVYQDMKDFIMLYQKNIYTAKENAVFHLKRLFESHWGSRVILIQKAIHDILYQEDGIKPVT